MKKASIKMAILIPTIAVLTAGIIALVAVVGTLSFNTTGDLTDRILEARVNQYANEFRAYSEDVYGAALTAKTIIANFTDPEFTADVLDPRSEVIGILSNTLMSNDKIVSMWTCWEPDAFDGKDGEYANTSFYGETGRFAPCVYKDGNDYGVLTLTEDSGGVEGDFYQGALKSGKNYVSDPYVYDFGGNQIMIYTISVPIVEDGKVVGVVGVDINLQDTIQMMNAGTILDDGYFITLSSGGIIATHPNTDLLTEHYDTGWMKDYRKEIDGIAANGGSFSLRVFSDKLNAYISYLATGITVGGADSYWVICGIIPESTVNASSLALLWTIIAIGFALIVVAGVTVFFIVRGRLKNLPAITATAEALAMGDIDSAIPDIGAEQTRNEIILLVRAFSSMTAGIRRQSDALTKIAQGDYSVSIPVRSDKDVMNQAINNMLDNTNDALNRISSAAERVSTGSKQIADGAQSLAQGSTEQASAVEELSASISEIRENTIQNADVAREAADLTGLIRGSAEKGTAQMAQMMQAVEEINEASSQISKVIKVIDDIAFQTNILALNAAVEAARAGQNGKGFAVVAEEVRNLAAKSAEAAKDTSGLIENSVEKANLGLNIATETAESLKEIVEGINRSAEIVAQIARSSDDQTAAVGQINTGIGQVAQVVQQNSATAQESAAASQEMSSQSDMLTQLTAQFTLKGAEPGRKVHSLHSAARSYGASDNAGYAADRDNSGYGKY